MLPLTFKTGIMENIYEAYTREIDNNIYYFVKKKTRFPELNGIPEILDSYGMHADFYKACSIAHIKDEKIISTLMQAVQIIPESARVVPMVKEKSFNNAVVRNTHHVLSRLRLAGI